MSEINKEKRVVIQNDGQVVVYNDNARIDANGTTSRIEGDSCGNAILSGSEIKAVHKVENYE